jgi:aldose 1-epimerase
MSLTGAQFTISAGEHEATVVEVGGGLRRYRHRGADVTCTYPSDVLPPKCCGGVLVPWPNRLRHGQYSFEGKQQQVSISEPSLGNAIHGLGRWDRWRLIDHGESAVSLGLDIVPQKGWPFEVDVEVRYSLDVTSGLRVDVSARNHGERRAPFGAGFHPYLSSRGALLEDVLVTVPADDRLLVDDAQVPIRTRSVQGSEYDLRAGARLGALRMDTGFTGLRSDSAQMRTPDGDGARVWFDSAFGYLQVFTVEQFPGAATAGVAIEPMTCAPDAFNSGDGLLVLEPGATWRACWGITPLA